MLINKWLLTDRIAAVAGISASTSVCITLKNRIQDRPLFFESIQKGLMGTPFAIMLDKEANDGAEEATFIEDIIFLFFQPSYYFENGQPVVFVNNGAQVTPFTKLLLEKSIGQGIKPVIFKEVLSESQSMAPQKCFNFLLSSNTVDLDGVLKEWIAQCIEDKEAPAIHILVPINNVAASQIIAGLDQQEVAIKTSERYKLAHFLYEQQQLIEDYKLQLEIKTAEAKNTSLYLSIQKEERANALKWYEKEYEVLPLWYKQFGHIIKVITGKRTFGSLFQNDVKKLKV